MGLKAQTSNLFDTSYFNKAKPIVFYTISSWCSENISDLYSIKDTLVEYRNKFDLILLIDTVSNKFHNYDYKKVISILNPSKTLLINQYFPKRLQILSENKKFTREFNNFFSSNFYRLGPSSMFYIKNFSVQVVPILNRSHALSVLLNK